jgi:hypothetical protein
MIGTAGTAQAAERAHTEDTSEQPVAAQGERERQEPAQRLDDI